MIDRRAFGRLFERHAPMVHGILIARLEPDDADDLMQDVFVTALEQLATLREESAFGGWLASAFAHPGPWTFQATALPPRIDPRPSSSRIVTTLLDVKRVMNLFALGRAWSSPSVAASAGALVVWTRRLGWRRRHILSPRS